MRARGCQGMDGAFKAVEYMHLTVLAHLKTFVIFVTAYFAFSQLAILVSITYLFLDYFSFRRPMHS